MTAKTIRKAIKTIAMIGSLIFLVFLTGCKGCSYKDYSGENPDLYTVAINSLLWNVGHSSGADWFYDSDIKILEKDEFGRTLFTYYENRYSYENVYFSSLIVSQYSADGYVYYYEDLNYLVKEQNRNSQQLRDFSEEEKEKLKTANDWGKELDFEKCTKKQIIQNKETIPTGKDTIEEEVRNKFNLTEKEYIFFNYLTSDKSGNYIIYGYIKNTDTNYTLWVALVNSKGNVADCLVPKNPYDYQEELRSFKSKNGWTNT